MQLNKYLPETIFIFEKSKQLAQELEHKNVGVDLFAATFLSHLSLGCLTIIRDHSMLSGLIKESIELVNKKQGKQQNKKIGFTPKLRKFIESCEEVSFEIFGLDYVAPEIIFVNLMSPEFATPVFKKTFFDLNGNYNELADGIIYRTTAYLKDEENELFSMNPFVQKKEEFEMNEETHSELLDMFSENEVLSQFAENLNIKAAQGYFDKVVDFDGKIEELATILCRKKKPNAILVGPAGTGKCLGFGTKVLMHNGSYKEVQDICVGDLVMGVDSQPQPVLSLGRGRDQMYKIEQKKGQDYIVNSEHILSLRHSTTGKIVNISVKDYLTKSNNFKNLHKGWKTAVDFPQQDTIVDPYFWGLYLGDGTTSNPSITNIDPELVEYIQEFRHYNFLSDAVFNDTTYSLASKQKYTVELHDTKQQLVCFNSFLEAAQYIQSSQKLTTSIKNISRHIFSAANGEAATAYGCRWKCCKHQSIVLQALQKFDFKNKGKYIADEFKYNSRDNRLKLLAGLIDSDGHYSRGCYEITQKNQKLANDIVFLANSLGFYASCKEKQATMRREDSSIYQCVVYRIVISGHLDQIPCKVERKKALPRKQKKNVLNTGINITPLGEDNYYGFTIGGDHLFILEDFTVTHNTSIVEGLALSIVNSKAPELLANKVIYSLSLSSMVAGTQYRGQFEERLEKFINEAKKYENLILFIDEIHTLVGAGGSQENSLEASNILKPELARGTISCIGATTVNEYTHTIKKDSALDRRFERVAVREPSKFQMKEILPTIVEYYEQFHRVKYSQDFLDNVIDYCERFMPNKCYPDKAVDVIDHCGAQTKVKYWNMDGDIQQLKDKIFNDENEESNKEALFEEFESKFFEWSLEKRQQSAEVTLEQLKAFFYKKENPLNNSIVLNAFFEQLKHNFVGNKASIKELKDALVLSNFGFDSSDGGLPIFCINGTKYSGKSMFVKTLQNSLQRSGANVLYYNGVHFSDFYANYKIVPERHNNTSLCEKVLMHPNSIIIIDDFHKVHESTYTLFAEIFKEGKIQMLSGDIADFSNCKFFLTGDAKSVKSMGFGGDKEKPQPMIPTDISKYFTVNTFFGELNKKDLRRVLWSKLQAMHTGFKIKDVELIVDFKFIKSFVDNLPSEGNKIQILNERFEAQIKNKVASQILNGQQKILLKNP